MIKRKGGGLAAALVVFGALSGAGCQMTGGETATRRVQALDEIVADQRRANEELRTRLTAADTALAAARAEADRLRGRDEAYTRAREALEARLRELEQAFPETGDQGFTVEKVEGGGYKFVVQGEVLFGLGEADLTDEGKAALRRIAEALKGRPERIRVEGHSDNIPIVKPDTRARFPLGNLDLSMERALRVADFLIKEGGVDAKRVSAAGWGEWQPRADNGTAEGRRRNRRVEILVQAD